METFLFKFVFERNGNEETFEVLAPDSETAYNILIQNHPEYLHFEVVRVDKEKTSM